MPNSTELWLYRSAEENKEYDVVKGKYSDYDGSGAIKDFRLTAAKLYFTY